MSSIEVVENLIKEYQNRDLKEADTRFQIIDILLQNVLSWPRGKTLCEQYIEGNKADYVLYNKASLPVLIIEAKKEETYFKLPNNINSNANFQKVIIKKLISEPDIKNALLQVKEYCEDLGCSYGAICNGHEWIIFHVNPQNVPWKTLPAFVITNLKFFRDNYTDAFNLLGYNSIVNNSSLRNNIGITRSLNSEIFYPKNSITSFNTPVNSNLFSSIFNSISRKYLENIPTDNSEFMETCYVTDKGHYDDLQKNVQGVIYDSLTPFFKNQGFQDFDDDENGGKFAKKIQNIIKNENLDNVMILFGGRGSGKSTFLKRFLFFTKPKEIEKYAHISLVDLINAAQTPEELTKEIWQRVCINIDSKNILNGEREDLISLFKDKFEVFNKQILLGLEKDSSDYKKLITQFILDCKNDIKYCSERLSLFWKSKGKGLVIVLDNLDQLPSNLQDICYLTSIEVAKKLSCLVIISMREERFYNVKSKGVLDAYHVPGFHIVSPVITEVIIKRIKYILNNLKTKDEFEFEDSKQLQTIIAFLEICKKEILRKTSDLSLFLRNTTHGDVRQALGFFSNFLSSGYTNIIEMSSNPDWKFQNHQVLKPMMIPDRFFYDERLSKIPNLFQIRNETNSSHFCGLRILNFLSKKSYEKSSSGFVDAKYLVQIFENNYDLKKDCEKHLNVFLEKGIIESSNRLEEYRDNVDQIRITAFGKYISEKLVYDFTYLDLVCLDCGIFDEKTSIYFIDTANKELEFYYSHNFMERIKLRINRVQVFLEYLSKQEEFEFKDIGLREMGMKFTPKLLEAFEKQKILILKSANNKKNKLK